MLLIRQVRIMPKAVRSVQAANRHSKEDTMVPLLSEIARFLRFLLTPETEVAAVQYEGAAAGAAKAGLWLALAVLTGLGLARFLS